MRETIKALRACVLLHSSVPLAERRDRLRAAMTGMDALRPRDPIEAGLSAQAIGTHYAIMEALAAANLPRTNPDLAARLRNYTVALTRSMGQTLQVLQLRQALTLPAPAPPAWVEDWEELEQTEGRAEAVTAAAERAGIAPGDQAATPDAVDDIEFPRQPPRSGSIAGDTPDAIADSIVGQTAQDTPPAADAGAQRDDDPIQSGDPAASQADRLAGPSSSPWPPDPLAPPPRLAQPSGEHLPPDPPPTPAAPVILRAINAPARSGPRGPFGGPDEPRPRTGYYPREEPQPG